MKKFMRLAIGSWPPDALPNAQQLHAWARKAVSKGATGLIIRHDDPAWVNYALSTLQVLRNERVRLGANTDWEADQLALDSIDFFHFGQFYDILDARNISQRRYFVFLKEQKKAVCITCHNKQELRVARGWRFNWVMLSPVFRTETHPNWPPLGLRRFQQLVSWIRMPVVALGGICASDEPALRAVGAAGWAAIRAFG